MVIGAYVLNAYAFLIALIIYIDGRKMQGQLFAHRIFMWIVKAAIVLQPIDVLAYIFNEKAGQLFYYLNIATNVLLYILAVIPAALWLVYADFQIFHDAARTRATIAVASAIVLFNGLITILSLYTGWYFTVDAQNVYHRGPLFWLHMLISYSVVLYTFTLILIQKKKIDRRYFLTLLLFPFPHMVGSIIQVLHYGVMATWPAMVVSVLTVYLTIQNSRLGTDYLTGAYNRMAFDQYLKECIENSSEKGFSGILLDVDGFKLMNDTLGHDAGDEALQDLVKLLRLALDNKGFLARYGGDEFFLLLDADTMEDLNGTVHRIRQAQDEYNMTSTSRHGLHFSMGYDVYYAKSGMRAEEFVKHLDKLMYADKEYKRQK